eukprot:13439842-Alexandrium_andersonii.AAC.1
MAARADLRRAPPSCRLGRSRSTPPGARGGTSWTRLDEGQEHLGEGLSARRDAHRRPRRDTG